MRKYRLSALSAVLALVAAAVLAVGDKPQVDLGPVVERNTAFGLSLFRQLRESEGNLFFSPYSISTALAMTYGGARGETQKEMADVLHFPLELGAHHEGFSALQSRVKAIQRNGSVRLSVANSLWAQRDYRFLEAFLKDTKRFYGAGLQTVDFIRETEAARLTINAWVEKETERKIEGLLKPDILTPQTRLVLCNAIYFKGNWAVRFDDERTRMADFFLAVDQPKKVPMMRQKMEIKFRESVDFSAIELPYRGNQVSMIVLLPAKIDGLPALEESLTAERLRECLSRLDSRGETSVLVRVPKFKTTSYFDLGDRLIKMGMRTPFQMDANFSGMTGDRELSISKVIHKAFVEVNEEGTEAAAATAVLAEGGAGPEVTTFNANHPFLFLIRDNETGSILFMGRMADPIEKGVGVKGQVTREEFSSAKYEAAHRKSLVSPEEDQILSEVAKHLAEGDKELQLMLARVRDHFKFKAEILTRRTGDSVSFIEDARASDGPKTELVVKAGQDSTQLALRTLADPDLVGPSSQDFRIYHKTVPRTGLGDRPPAEVNGGARKEPQE